MSLPRGLYALTDSALIPAGALVDRVGRAIAGGAVMIQYRDKRDDPGRRLWEAGDLAMLCRAQRVPFIVNDDIGLAHACRADGVHLGKDDAPIAKARGTLGAKAIIGVSCYDSLDLAEAAADAGADYVAFGSFFPSATKPDAVPAGLDLLRAARERLTIPIVAIGGITPENGADLVAAGADLLAVVQGVFAADDPTAAARRYADLYTL